MIHTDVIMLGWLRGAEDVGLYSASNRIIQFLYVIPSVIAASTLPSFSRLAFREPEKMRSVLERVLGASLLLVAIPAAIGGAVLAKDITVGVFGESFIRGAGAFRILMFTLLVDFI